jgi:iduronate 2-sulfatase
MSRRSLMPVVLCCSLFVGSLRVVAAAEGPRPNVLWIISDDLSCDLGCYGQSIVSTPHIDRLASRGVRFDRAYTQYALCNPSRSSFLSGYGPDRTGVIDQDFRARDKLPNAVFLPQLFKQSGYFVAAAGKVHHGGKHVDEPSWNEYNDAKGTDARELELAQFRSRNPDRTPRWGAAAGEGETTSDGVNTRKVVSYLNQSATFGKPFFLTLGLHKPHVQWVAPQSCIDLYPPATMPRRDWLKGSDVPPIALQTEWPNGSYNVAPGEGLAAYFSCVSFTDLNVGLVLEAIDRLDLWKNTIVVFVSDHGFHHGDRGLWSKKTLFEQSLHVPLIVALPDGRNAGRASRRTVQLLDVYPTLADLCGLAAPDDLEGHSLRPLLDDPNAPWTWPARSQVLHEGVMGRSIRTERWRYTEWDGGNAGVELYDHDTDPLELVNLAGRGELAGVLKELSSALHGAD